MADPQTANIAVYQVPRGGDAGSWDSPTNANWGAMDSLAGNVATIGLTNAPVTLTTPPNSGASWNGPYQSQSALLQFTGAITANCVVTIPRAGYFMVQNLCTSGSTGFYAGASPGSFYVQLTTGVAGNVIGVPPGKKCHVFSDGTNMDFVNMPDPGTRLDLHGLTALPTWMTACTVRPYLIRDGSIYNNSAYPGLASVLQNTFGGTPGLSFAVPDSRARVDVGYDAANTGRLTNAASGVSGAIMGSAGGNQNMQQHNHAATGSDSGHQHSTEVTGLVYGFRQSGSGVAGGSGYTPDQLAIQTTGVGEANITVNVANAGLGGSQNVQPTIVSFLPLVKT